MSRLSLISVLSALLLSVSLSGCRTAGGNTPDEKREHTQAMASKTLDEVYAEKPENRAMVSNAAGYAVFSTISTKIIILGSGSGFGVVHDNATNANTYMKMKEVEAGLGVGYEDHRLIFVFHNREILNKFANEGWEFGDVAAAEAKTGTTGGAAATESVFGSGSMTVLRLDEGGLALQASLTGITYTKDKDLN